MARSLKVMAALAVAAAGVLAACDSGPSCAQRGGHQEFSHFNTILVPSGKAMIPIMQPVYRCEIP